MTACIHGALNRNRFIAAIKIVAPQIKKQEHAIYTGSRVYKTCIIRYTAACLGVRGAGRV